MNSESEASGVLDTDFDYPYHASATSEVPVGDDDAGLSHGTVTSASVALHSDILSATMDSHPHSVDLEMACDGEGVVCGAGTLVVTLAHPEPESSSSTIPLQVAVRSWTLVAPVNSVINVFINSDRFDDYLCVNPSLNHFMYSAESGCAASVVRSRYYRCLAPTHTGAGE